DEGPAGAYDTYGNSYTGNYYSGSTVRLNTLIDPKDPEGWRPIKGVTAHGSSEFIIAGENGGFGQAYNDTNISNFKRFHWIKFTRWTMLFADGHSSPVDVTLGTSAGSPPSYGPGWRFEWKLTH